MDKKSFLIGAGVASGLILGILFFNRPKPKNFWQKIKGIFQ